MIFRLHKKKNASQDRVRQFNLHGEVQLGNNGTYSIQGTDFNIDNNTWVIGELGVGKIADVRGVWDPEQGRYATKVKVSAA